MRWSPFGGGGGGGWMSGHQGSFLSRPQMTPYCHILAACAMPRQLEVNEQLVR
jgi:hypothetical protein